MTLPLLSDGRFVMTTRRIESLSDCIFAFSMTLLVMNFSFPGTGPVSEQQVTDLFLKQIGKFDRYVLAFALISVFWITHHQQFHHIKRTDRRFLWIQIACLMFIVIMPFTAAWMSAYSNLFLTNMIFDVNLFILGFLFSLSWFYATHKRRLVDENIDSHSVRAGILRSLLSCGVSLVALCIAFFHPGWSNYAFILIPILLFLKPFRHRHDHN
ncbi:MAG: TMEM175 family protein [Syntrophorhabdaceae bacterium]